MSEMIERVAKAISMAVNNFYDPKDNHYRICARAAIESMRDPTPEMLHHGVGYTDFILPQAIGEGHEDYLAEMKCAWVSMIDVALSPSEGDTP